MKITRTTKINKNFFCYLKFFKPPTGIPNKKRQAFNRDHVFYDHLENKVIYCLIPSWKKISTQSSEYFLWVRLHIFLDFFWIPKTTKTPNSINPFFKKSYPEKKIQNMSSATAAGAPSPPTSSSGTATTRTSDCRKFSPNIFNKSKCSHCFRQREEHSAAALECNRVSRIDHE